MRRQTDLGAELQARAKSLMAPFRVQYKVQTDRGCIIVQMRKRGSCLMLSAAKELPTVTLQLVKTTDDVAVGFGALMDSMRVSRVMAYQQCYKCDAQGYAEKQRQGNPHRHRKLQVQLFTIQEELFRLRRCL